MRVGIVANELFDPALGRMGGFGWVARHAALSLAQTTAWEPVFYLAEGRATEASFDSLGIRTIARQSGWSRSQHVRYLARHTPDVLLLVDWRPEYRRIVLAQRRVPVILWVQDPRTPYDNNRVLSLQLPNDDAFPLGINEIDCTGWIQVARLLTVLRRPMAYASHAHYLEEKALGTYGVAPTALHFLGDPVQHPAEQELRPRSATPSVVFLGRLDPIKRPWLFVELARRFPNVDFIVLGQSHFDGRGSWQPSNVPSNVHFRGHVGDEDKRAVLGSAWACVNTSIHEALPISFLEALGWRVPLLAAQDPDEVVSRFGYYVGRRDGDGAAMLPALEENLRILISNDDIRERRGSAGREWVLSTHTPELFRTQLDCIVRNAIGLRPR